MKPSSKANRTILSLNIKHATLSESAAHVLIYLGDTSNISQIFVKYYIADRIVLSRKNQSYPYMLNTLTISDVLQHLGPSVESILTASYYTMCWSEWT